MAVNFLLCLYLRRVDRLRRIVRLRIPPIAPFALLLASPISLFAPN